VNIKTSRGSSSPGVLDTEQRELLSRKISDLALKIPGTRLEGLVRELYQELEKAGISLQPKTYLSDEWGCPHGVPVIGIPFYLADPRLCRLEGEITGIEAETDAEIATYLRHEAGHAFNYAYRLYLKPDFRRTFGRFSQPYNEEYKPVPFSARFVRHIPGWYAQKHPDEDFAETFAVWLTPGSDWRKTYAGAPALTKLLYIDRKVRRYGGKPPAVTSEKLDRPVQELKITLDKWYDTNMHFNRKEIKFPPILDEDLKRLFPEREGEPAAKVLRAESRRLVREVNRWTGMDRRVLESVFDEITERVRLLGLKTGPGQTTARLVSAAIFVTTLVMNYQLNGQFIEE
jgi:hypothetical protein